MTGRKLFLMRGLVPNITNFQNQRRCESLCEGYPVIEMPTKASESSKHLPQRDPMFSSSQGPAISISAGWANGCSSIQIQMGNNKYIRESSQKCNVRLNLRRAKEKKKLQLIGRGSCRQLVSPLMTWPASWVFTDS